MDVWDPEPARWRALLRKGATGSDLSRIWRTECESVEQRWARFSELIGLDPVLSGTGGLHHQGDALPAGFSQLGFRVAPGVPWLAGEGLPPRLEAKDSEWAASKGVAGRTSSSPPTLIASVGGPGRGLVIAVDGPAVEAGLFRDAFVGLQGHGPLREVEAPLVPANDGAATTLLASFETFVIPPGCLDRAALHAAVRPSAVADVVGHGY